MNCHSWKSLFGLILTAGTGLVLLGDGTALRAQAPPEPSQAPPAQRFSLDQLDDLVAPIALYPDQLLSQILVACTYPLEVVEAQQWLQRNNTLRGQQLMDAARQQNWDASVQALVAFPDVLARLNQDVRWTTDLGNAFLAQQADVMSAVQRMRARAQANGKLSSNPQETVTTETQGGQSAIQIQPADPQVIYVPNYDPAYIWGPPAWGYYPSLYYPAFGFGFWPGINIGLCFGGWGYGGWGGWGWGPNWFGRSVFVNNVFFNHYGFRGGYGHAFGGAGFGGRSMWAHDPGHRLGVPYSNGQLAGRYGAASLASRAQRFGGQSSYNRSLGASRNGFQASRQGASTFPGNRSGYGGHQAFSGSQGYRGSTYQSRSFQGRSFQSAPGNSGISRSFSSGGARSYSGGNARSYSGGNARSYSAPAARSFSGGSARSFGGGGGGGARSFGGGGGGGFHGGSGGGGGHSGGGGHGGGRR